MSDDLANEVHLLRQDVAGLRSDLDARMNDFANKMAEPLRKLGEEMGAWARVLDERTAADRERNAVERDRAALLQSIVGRVFDTRLGQVVTLLVVLRLLGGAVFDEVAQRLVLRVLGEP
jgi:hypothetical protein